MTEIILTNITLPTEGPKKIILCPDGTVQEINNLNEAVMATDSKATTVPYHGPLLDKDRVVATLLAAINIWQHKPQTTRRDATVQAYLKVLKALEETPVIVEAHRQPEEA